MTVRLVMLTINALAAADSVLIPCQANYLSTKGLKLLMGSVAKVRRQINPELKIDGILLTMVDSRTNNAKSIIAALRKTGSNLRVLGTEIPFSVRAAVLAEQPRLSCIVRELTDDEAIIIMVDSNLQREKVLPSEKAFAYRMKLDAMKRQGQRTDLTSSPVAENPLESTGPVESEPVPFSACDVPVEEPLRQG